MLYSSRPCRSLLISFLFASLLTSIPGCGGGSAFSQPPQISVSLNTPSVVVPQTGMQVVVPINIMSPSETALVNVSGLPGGILQGYAPSDTNPSGVLTFKGDSSAPIGTYMPTITVHSAGAIASTQFTLMVTKSAK